MSLHLNQAIEAVHDQAVTLGCTYTGRETPLDCNAVLMVTSRSPNDALYHTLMDRQPEWHPAGIQTIKLIGDAAAPGPIAWTTYGGRRYAEEKDEPSRGDALSLRREIVELSIP